MSDDEDSNWIWWIIIILIVIGSTGSGYISGSSYDYDREYYNNKDTIVCSTNYYDCSDFSTCSEVKEVFFKCGSSSDIHYLDGDGDGIPCERYQGSGLC